MDNYLNGFMAELAEYETPFADVHVQKEEPFTASTRKQEQFFVPELESPFTTTYETTQAGPSSPVAGEFVNFLGELHDAEFEDALYELANEMEDTWSSKISSETAMGDRFLPYTTQQANEYLMPLAVRTESMIDEVAKRFSGNDLSDMNEAEIDRFFSEMEFENSGFLPAQEQFFGKIFDKVKSVVKKGVSLAKKGIAAVGKILPVNIILRKLKGLVRPLLDKVLRFAIGKLPKNLQPYAQSLAKKFLNLETAEETNEATIEVPATSELGSIQTELDNRIAQLVFSSGEGETDQLVMEYESSSDNLQRSAAYEMNGLNLPSLPVARQQFVEELKNLRPGENAAPAIERFLPVAIMALQPVIKMGISIIGREKVIDFLANLLSQLVSKYVPAEIAKPLSAKIIDIGMSAIGFETSESESSDLAYEAIANTVEETVQNLGTVNETTLSNQEMLTAQVLEAFEKAAANNFPGEYIREDLRNSTQPGVWVLKPRKGPRHMYKKYSRVFNITIDPQTAKTVTGFRGLPLASFLRDKYGIDTSKPVQARVHLYEAIEGTRLSMIARYEKVQGLGSPHNKAWTLFQPLTKQAASLLLKEPRMGKDISAAFTQKHPRIAIGQQFYYLELPGARLKLQPQHTRLHKQPVTTQPVPVTVPHSGDVQAVINFVKSEIRFNYFFSEEEAASVVEKLNKNDYLGAAVTIRTSVRNVLNNMLVKNVGDKVRIIHEAVPEMYLNEYPVSQENFAPAALLQGMGKEVIGKIIEKLVDRLATHAYESIAAYFKARAAEFKQAQAEPKDGVTIKIIWVNIPGMSTIRAIINAIRGKLSVGNLADLTLPNIPTPEVKVLAGKNFD